MRIYGILLKVKRPSFNPYIMLDLAVCRSTGSVDRCAQTCTSHLAGRPVYRPGRPPESFALWIWPRSTGRSTGRELLFSVSRSRSTNRSTGGTIVRNLTVVSPVDWPVDQDLDTKSKSSLPVDRPVDRGQIQRAGLSGGRPGRSTGL